MSPESYLLRVAQVRPETTEAVSVVFEVPDELAATYAFAPGQFLTLGIPSDRTDLVPRCYSLCVPPGDPLTITVKRTAGGYASVWLTERVRAGEWIRVLPPSGIFTPRSLDADLLLWAAGSGITPVMSILRAVLEQGTGRVTLLHADQDHSSVIFGDAIDRLAETYVDRFVHHRWLVADRGLPTLEPLRDLAAPLMAGGYTSYCCGPAPFMQRVQTALRELGVPKARRHQERFVSLTGNPFGDVAALRVRGE